MKRPTRTVPVLALSLLAAVSAFAQSPAPPAAAPVITAVKAGRLVDPETGKVSREPGHPRRGREDHGRRRGPRDSRGRDA